jgi:hypothetical protein
MMRTLFNAALGVAMCCGVPSAAAGDGQAQVVKINAIKNPEIRSYRTVAAGLDAFDDYHQLAPAVPELRFRMVPRDDLVQPDQPPSLRLAGDDFSQPIPIAPSGHFSVPRSAAAWDSDADLVLNRKKNTYRASVDIRTPGLPDNVRRLGDLRLECKVSVAIGKKEAPFWLVAAANAVLLTGDWCSKLQGEDSGLGYLAQTELTAATLIEGERKLALRTEKRIYTVPIGDASWGNDALVELSYINAANPAGPAE